MSARAQLNDLAIKLHLEKRTRAKGYFNPSFVQRLFQLHREGKAVCDSALWMFLSFELEHRISMDGGDP